MTLIAALFTIALIYAVYKVLAITLSEYRGKLISVIERAELLREIREDRARSVHYAHV